MRRPVVMAAVTAAVAVVFGAVTAAGATRSITVGDNFFVSDGGVPIVKATENKRVTFEFVGRFTHDIKATKGPVKFQSGPTSTGPFVTPKLKKGDYTVICAIHGATDMSMKLKVKPKR